MKPAPEAETRERIPFDDYIQGMYVGELLLAAKFRDAFSPAEQQLLDIVLSCSAWDLAEKIEPFQRQLRNRFKNKFEAILAENDLDVEDHRLGKLLATAFTPANIREVRRLLDRKITGIRHTRNLGRVMLLLDKYYEYFSMNPVKEELIRIREVRRALVRIFDINEACRDFIIDHKENTDKLSLSEAEQWLQNPDICSGNAAELYKLIITSLFMQRRYHEALPYAEAFYQGCINNNWYSRYTLSVAVGYLQNIHAEILSGNTFFLSETLKEAGPRRLQRWLNHVLGLIHYLKLDEAQAILRRIDPEVRRAGVEDLMLMYRLIRTEFFLLAGDVRQAENEYAMLKTERGKSFLRSYEELLVEQEFRIMAGRSRYLDILRKYESKPFGRTLQALRDRGALLLTLEVCYAVAVWHLDTTRQKEAEQRIREQIESGLQNRTLSQYRRVRNALLILDNGLKRPSPDLQHFLRAACAAISEHLPTTSG